MTPNAKEFLLNPLFQSVITRPAGLLVLVVVLLAGSPARAQCVVLEAKSSGRPDLGVAWCVDAAKGLFVTDYQLVAGETQVRLGNQKGSQVDAKEFVAADRGKSLLLLKIAPPQALTAFPLAKDMPPLDATLGMHVAVGTLTGKLKGLESGEDYLLGLKDRRLTLPTRDPDTAWLRTDLISGPRQRGAPLLSPQGEVVGVVVGSDAEDNYLTRAVHVNHIRVLLKQADAPPKPLSELGRFNTGPVQEPIPDWTELDLVSSLHKRSRPLVERLQQCLDRQKAESDMVAVHQTEFNRSGAEVRDLKAKVDKNEGEQTVINRRATAIQSDRPLIAVPAPPGKRDDDDPKGKGGKGGQPKLVNVLAPLNAGQIAELNGLSQSRQRLQAEWAILDAELQVKQNMQGLYRGSIDIRKRRGRSLPLQLLTLIDGNQFASPAEQQAAADWFVNLLRTRPGNDVYLVGHALALLPLQKHAQALQQLDTALLNVDEVSRPAISAARARALIQMGKVAEGKTELAAALNAGKSDPLVLHWAGLAACDAGHFAKGAEYLQSAFDRGGDPVAIKIALALVHATAPVDEVRSGDKSVQHAARACELTYWQDWHAQLALAAAFAEQQNFPRALQCADQALQLAPAADQPLCQKWHATIAAGKPIRDVWGTFPAAP